jgi:hypothetical protein
MTTGVDTHAPIAPERIVALEPITRDDLTDEPSDDDRRAPRTTRAADPDPAHRREPSRRATA